MQRKIRTVLVVILMLGLVALLSPRVWAGGHRGTELIAKLIEAAKEERELNLVAGGTTWGGVNDVKELEKAFNRRYGLNAKINFLPGPAMSVMARRIAGEFEAGQPAATDLYIGSETHIPFLFRRKVLQVFPWREAFPHIPEEMIEVGGQTVREATRFIGITYNSRLVAAKDAPRRLDDLLNPAWKGKIASGVNAQSFDRLAQVIGVERTREFLRKFTQNIGGLIRCGEDERVASGEFLVFALNCGDFFSNVAAARGLPISAVVLDDAPMAGYWYLSVPKNSRRPNLATLFIGFLLTKEAQDLRYRAIGASAHLIEGTPANQRYKELAGRGIKLRDFPVDEVIKHQKKLAELRDEFQKILREKR